MTRRQISKRAVFVTFTILGASAAVGGCGSSEGSPSVSISAGSTASTAPASGAELGAADFAAALKRPATVVLDVRTPAEFASGHLPGAVNIDLNGDDFQGRVAELDRGLPYAVYCRSGSRSAAAVKIMKSTGFEKTFHLAGGINSWGDAQGEIVTGS